MGSSQIRDWTRVSCIGLWILIPCSTRDVLVSTYFNHDSFHDPALPWASWKGHGDRGSPVPCHADFSPLTNKIELSKFEDPIGFTQGFMSWADSHVVTRRMLQEAVQKCKVFTGESQFLGRLIRSPGVPKERGVWNSQGGRKGKCFFSLCIP